MDVKRPVLIMLALLGVVLTLVAMQGTVGGSWTSVAQKVTPMIAVIAFLGLVIMIMLGRD